eukprot:1876963-Amphidinium_carterae.5
MSKTHLPADQQHWEGQGLKVFQDLVEQTGASNGLTELLTKQCPPRVLPYWVEEVLNKQGETEATNHFDVQNPAEEEIDETELVGAAAKASVIVPALVRSSSSGALAAGAFATPPSHGKKSSPGGASEFDIDDSMTNDTMAGLLDASQGSCTGKTHYCYVYNGGGDDTCLSVQVFSLEQLLCFM